MLRIPAFCDIMDDGKNNRYAAEIEHQGTDLGLDAAAALPPSPVSHIRCFFIACSFMTSGRVSSWKKTCASMGKTRESLVFAYSPE
jgi:hypothetical protein